MKRQIPQRSFSPNASANSAGSLPWSYFVILAIGGCMLAAGFFLAARQHFSSIDLGMRNSKMRRQLEDLESENRRLTLAREVAISPAEITKTALQLGFVEVGGVTANVPIPLPASSSVAPPAQAKLTHGASQPDVPASLTRTAYQRAVKPAVADLVSTASKKTDKPKLAKPDSKTLAKR